MIDVATLSVIRRWALREQLSIREVARRTGLSRNTVRKYLREGEAAPSYAKRISPSKIDVFAEKLRSWLKTEAAKSRKQRRTLKQMHADLAALGYIRTGRMRTYQSSRAEGAPYSTATQA